MASRVDLGTMARRRLLAGLAELCPDWNGDRTQTACFGTTSAKQSPRKDSRFLGAIYDGSNLDDVAAHPVTGCVCYATSLQVLLDDCKPFYCSWRFSSPGNRYKFTSEAPFIALSDYVNEFFDTLYPQFRSKPAGSVLHNLLNFRKQQHKKNFNNQREFRRLTAKTSALSKISMHKEPQPQSLNQPNQRRSAEKGVYRELITDPPTLAEPPPLTRDRENLDKTPPTKNPRNLDLLLLDTPRNARRNGRNFEQH